MGQLSFKKYFEFHSFSEMFYCSMTKLKNTNSDVFIQCQYTGTILRNVGQNLFKKYSKYQIFDEICCGLTRFRDIKLGAFRQYQNLKTILKKKNMEQNCFKKLSKFHKISTK